MTERMPVDHGRVRMFLPGDWEDRSTLLFVAPSHAALEAPLAARRTAEKHRALSVTLDPTDARSIDDYVLDLVSAISPISIAGRTGACGERRVQTRHGFVRQLVAAILVEDGLALLAVASVDEASFEAHRDELVDLIGRIELR